MKNFLLVLMVVLTTCTLAIAQNNTTVVRVSAENAKASVKKGGKANMNHTAVTVIGVDTTETDSIETDAGSSSISHGNTNFTRNTDDYDFPFNKLENAIDGGIVVALVAIVSIFVLPVFILFVTFFFRYKNRKARYRLAEQALAAGQPLPADFICEKKHVDQRSQGIKNTFTGIGLFIFFWAITGEFGIGTIGLLIAFMGIGQWIVGYQQQPQDANTPQTYTNKDERSNLNNVETDNFEIISSESEKKDLRVNEEKDDENK